MIQINPKDLTTIETAPTMNFIILIKYMVWLEKMGDSRTSFILVHLARMESLEIEDLRHSNQSLKESLIVLFIFGLGSIWVMVLCPY